VWTFRQPRHQKIETWGESGRDEVEVSVADVRYVGVCAAVSDVASQESVDGEEQFLLIDLGVDGGT
jgi:hypothetical protein